ncbi:uncharacterized protein LOC111067461 [Drosophila obscura]|uniref:uncharacterized protein LOC111067461 n=1 Tax=Drosophila obscura TaxID=7282 RepID=UPI001BB2543E|nr:uncharacterized protein LOC111067461 [Drosophila obscura]
MNTQEDEDREGMPPISTTTFGIPNDPALLDEYELYRPSMGTRRLVSELHREIYPEAFIEHERLGTLADLCVRALAKNQGTLHIALPVQEDPLKLRIHYDSIDVDLPLRECYFVEDLRYWRRVVLAKSSDKSLALKKLAEYDWRGKGISIKYVEMVESCPAAFWPEREMAELAGLVREHVRTMDIRHLQSRTEESFQPQMQSSDSEPDVTSEESEELIISSDERNTSSEFPDEQEEECSEEQSAMEQPQQQPQLEQKSSHTKPKQAKIIFNELESTDQEQSGAAAGQADEGAYLVEGIQEDKRVGRAARNAVRQQLRDMQAAKREQHEQRQHRRTLMRQKPVEEPLKKSRKSRKTVMGVFNMKVEAEKEDEEEKIVDNRNKQKLLARIKRFDYPSEYCHHVDLSFVRFFDNLVSLTLEFLGPHMGREFHRRHLRFSLEDMLRLARGLQALDKLQIFRLRNSRMDQLKLHALCGGLRDLKALEVVDFGYDQMSDDCGATLGSLLKRETMLKALELEYNQLDLNAASAIGAALMQHHQDAGAMHLQYLGLAHNRMSDKALSTLVHYIVGTDHVEELNVSAITARKEVVADSLGYLLRNHPPLRRLDLAAIPMNSTVGRRLVCALERNQRVTHFDCRGCDMDSDEEFEASIIVRRNAFQTDHSYIGDETKTEQDIQEHFKSIKHPLVQKLEGERQRQAECLKVRPPLASTPSETSMRSLAEEKEEPEYDIWAELGIKTKLSAHQVPEPSVSSHSSVSDKGPFYFDPNSFDLEQFREHIHHQGIGNRYYYFKSRREQR